MHLQTAKADQSLYPGDVFLMIKRLRGKKEKKKKMASSRSNGSVEHVK